MGLRYSIVTIGVAKGCVGGAGEPSSRSARMPRKFAQFVSFRSCRLLYTFYIENTLEYRYVIFLVFSQKL